MNIVGDSIKMARRALGLTGTDLAEAVGVTQVAISRYERGDREPDAETLLAIAHSLHVTPDFLQAGHGLEGAIAVDAHMRRRATSKVSDWRRAEAQINMLWMQAHRVFESIDMTPKLMLPVFDPMDVAADSAARLTRGQWHMPVGAVADLMGWLEGAGVCVAVRDLGTPRIDGLSLRRGATSVVLLNSAAPPDRQRLTLAHELGHLVLHSEYAEPDMEDQANAFAAEFLMPAAAIKPYLFDLTLAQAEALKIEWGVSMQALIQRAAGLGTIDRKRQTALYKQLSSRGQRTREPGSDRISLGEPALIPTLTQRMQAAGVSEQRIRDLTGVCDPHHPASLFTTARSRPLIRVK